MDREYVLTGIRDFGESLGNYAEYEEFTDDEEIVLEAVKGNGEDLVYASARLRNTKKIVMAAVEQNPMAFKHAEWDMRHDVDVASLAIKKDPRLVSKIDKEVLNDINFASSLINANMAVTKYLPSKVMTKINEVNTNNVFEKINSKNSLDTLSDEEFLYLESLVAAQRNKRTSDIKKK